MRSEAAGFILFDLDGTLIDGVDDLVTSINRILAEQGLAPLQRAELEAMLGDGMRALTLRAFAARGLTLAGANHDQACDAFLQAYADTRYAQTRLFDGVEPTLRQLASDGWRIGLASNKPTAPCHEILKRLGIHELFAVVAGGDATSVRKPAGGHLTYALARMGWREGSDLTVMVGDHANDVDAARAAGLAAIAVAFEVDDTKARTLGADAVVTDFRILPEVLARLSRCLVS